MLLGILAMATKTSADPEAKTLHSQGGNALVVLGGYGVTIQEVHRLDASGLVDATLGAGIIGQTTYCAQHVTWRSM